MADVQGAASFNPDDASGLLDNARVKITALVVDFFTSKKGDRFVNADVTFEGGGQKVTEHYMIGGADQWAPNATKTGAISIVEGGKIWNKSDIFKFVKSMVDAGFPKENVKQDLSVFVGYDVHVSRTTQEGQTYVDKDGKERQRTTLLVTKIYEAPVGGKVGKAAAKATAAAAPATSTAGASDDSHDEYLTSMLIEILTENAGSVTKTALPQPVFIKATRAKKGGVREALQARIQSDAFLGSLAEQGLITVDGATIALASA